MSIAEAYDHRDPRSLLVPPRPAPKPDTMSTIRRMAAVRRSGIDGWGKAAYEEDILKGRFLGQNNFIVNAPDAIRHVLIENYENYTRTTIGIRVLRPILGSEGLLLSEGRAWKHQRRTLAPAFSPRAVMMLVPHMHAAIDDAIKDLNKQVGEAVDLREAMQRLTLDIAGRTMFSFSIDKYGPGTARLRDGVRHPAGAALPARYVAAARTGRARRISSAGVSASGGPASSRN